MAKEKLKIAALVPMKKNSERVPNKNMKLFNGKPLYHAIINTLLKSTYIDSIYIDTDSDLIINDVQINFPTINIINRPIELQGDFVSMNEIINHNLTILMIHYFLSQKFNLDFTGLTARL